MTHIYPYLLIILFVGTIIGAILLVLKSSKRFNLTQEQLDKIKKRNKELEKLEKEDE